MNEVFDISAVECSLIIQSLEVVIDNAEADRRLAATTEQKSACMATIKNAEQTIKKVRSKTATIEDIINTYPALLEYRESLNTTLQYANGNRRNILLDHRAGMNRLLRRLRPIIEQADAHSSE